MTGEMITVLAVLLSALVLWVTEWLPIDLVALSIPVVLILTGVLLPGEAVAGFASSALITVGAILVVSAGLSQTGVITYVGNQIIRFSKGDERRMLLLVMLTMAVFSGFINNTAVVAMFLPIMLGVAREFDVAPSKLLIPLSFASILGGTTSLIGTSTNVLVHGMMEQYGLDGLGMFEITPVGAVYAAVGLVYLYFVGHRLLPDRGTVTSYLGGTGAPRASGEYMTEVQVPAGSKLIGQLVKDSIQATHPNVRLLQVIRDEAVFWPPLDQVEIAAGDIFLLKGDANEMIALYQQEGLELVPSLKAEAVRYATQDMALSELVVTPNSTLVGRSLREIDFRKQYNASVMALQRHGEHLRDELPSIRVRVGDVLLVMCDRNEMGRLMSYAEFMVLEGVQEVVVNRDKAPIAIALVLGLVGMASLSSVPVMVLAMVSAILMVMTRCITMRQAYASLDMSVLMLIGGAISLGKAMDVTGTAGLIAQGVVDTAGAYGPQIVLSGVYLLTVLFTELMSNNAAAVLMVPIALSVANGLGVDPRPFAIAVAFAGSAAFSTPIGYQTNTLVYGPGGYKFTDFTRVGLPLNLLLWGVATLLIPLFWPLVPVG
ncbi:MAG: TRAP transporter large permease subunit [Acidobacteria bacterium]|nr:TRAP transporter large permease subunit [Acidobacteriota bacterium]